MAGSRNGRYLSPIVEAALVGDPDPRRRVVYELDTRTGRYTGDTWSVRSGRDANVVGDASMTGDEEMLVVERDEFRGAASVTKRIDEIDLRREDDDGYVSRTLVLDVVKIASPDDLAAGAGYGTGNPFSLPVQSLGTVVQLRDGRLRYGPARCLPAPALTPRCDAPHGRP